MPIFGTGSGAPMTGRAAVSTPEPTALGQDAQAAMLTQTAASPRLTDKDVRRAEEILQKYKSGKANLEARIVEDELWWELRHWEAIGRTRRDNCGKPILREAEPTSAWLFNSIANKHADAMDNYPTPVCLPRERSDEESAKVLSEVLPVIMEYNGFEQTYSEAWWEKLKHGTAVYGIFWDTSKENGLGDVDIRQIDLLNIFWEPGVQDIQKSRNLFTVELVDNDVLEERYPQLHGKLGSEGGGIDVKKYLYDDTVDTSDKSVVADWYYKVGAPGGRTVVQYAKFCNGVLLYASEDATDEVTGELLYRDRGYYDHGLYPFVLDTLYPEKGTPVGFGYVSVCRDPQLYIDKLYGNILAYAMKATRPRHFISTSTAVNEAEYADWQGHDLVKVEGQLDDSRIRQITLEPLPGIYADILQMKVEEMKDTSSNRDVNSGGTSHGVSAAAAISALQEAGNKVSRDMIAASYRTYADVISQVVELIRQFYDVSRAFRITGDRSGDYSFVDLDNSMIREQVTGRAADGTEMYRKPVFDIKISAQKKNPFSQLEQNERAKELYGLGFFNPERAQEALGALEMMDFEGIDKVREQVQEGQTLLNVCQQLSQQMEQMMMLVQGMAGAPLPDGGETPAEVPSGGNAPQPNAGGGKNVIRTTMDAHTPMTSYGDRLAKRSTPSMEGR